MCSPASRTARRSSSDGAEVTARLTEVPEGAIFKRDLYNYVTILKYEVLETHRGKVEGQTIYVGHYNPFKPRSTAADQQAEGIGGNLKTFRADQVHRMALDVPIDNYYMGGIVNKYFGQQSGPIYWAVWTNLAAETCARRHSSPTLRCKGRQVFSPPGSPCLAR